MITFDSDFIAAIGKVLAVLALVAANGFLSPANSP